MVGFKRDFNWMISAVVNVVEGSGVCGTGGGAAAAIGPVCC